MAYDESVADRLRGHLEGQPGLSEKKMFGGLAFLVSGHMAVAAVSQGGLLLRCDPAETDTLVGEPGVERFEMRGKKMNGWLAIDPSAIETEPALERWIAVGVDYAESLPPK